MWKSLKAIFTDDANLLENMIDDFRKMLMLGKDMIIMVTDYAFNDKDVEEIRGAFYKKDQEINRLEQKIRKEVVTYLSVKIGEDFNSCLVLLSIVHDAERIGDYTKNIFEIFTKVKRPDVKELNDLTESVRDKIIEWIDLVANAFITGDKTKAEKFIDESYYYEKKCDEVVYQIIIDQSNVNLGVYVLLFRFYKRIICHLDNIATSLVMPIDKLGYHKPRDKRTTSLLPENERK
ncbi:MAG: hypothetical protein Kow0090_20490 [Myxococcota bacterium]